MVYESPQRRWISLIALGLCGLLVSTLLIGLIGRARHRAHVSASEYMLRSYGLAFHNYHDVHRRLPLGGVFRDDGAPMSGWMSALMPYLDSSPWYNMVEFEEPWNHPVNRDLYQWETSYNTSPGVPAMWTTEGYPVSHFSANERAFFRNSNVTLSDFQSGTSHGWLLRDGLSELRPWGDPCNWQTLPSSPAAAVAENRVRGWASAQVLMVDGSVRTVDQGTSLSFWEALRASPDGVRRPDTRKQPAAYEISGHKWRVDGMQISSTCSPDSAIELYSNELFVRVQFNVNDEAESIRIMHMSKYGTASTCRADLEQIAARYPDISVLSGTIEQLEPVVLKQCFPRLVYFQGKRLPEPGSSPAVLAEGVSLLK